MADHHGELLSVASLLLARQDGQRGRLSAARVRRSISTSYYAIFHFAQRECAGAVVGSASPLLRRRRIFIRALSHTGVRLALDKVTGAAPAGDIAEFLFPTSPDAHVPRFASAFARSFIEAQRQRHAADYDLNASLGEVDAHRLLNEVSRAIDGWQAATTPADRDFKHALCLLMMLSGKLRNG